MHRSICIRQLTIDFVRVVKKNIKLIYRLCCSNIYFDCQLAFNDILKMQIEQRKINQYTAMFFHSHISLISDATWRLFEWKSVTITHISVTLLDFHFLWRLWGPWTSFSSSSFHFIYNQQHERFPWNFLDTCFLPCRLIQRVKIISSRVRRTDMSVKFYLNNIL